MPVEFPDEPDDQRRGRYAASQEKPEEMIGIHSGTARAAHFKVVNRINLNETPDVADLVTLEKATFEGKPLGTDVYFKTGVVSKVQIVLTDEDRDRGVEAADVRNQIIDYVVERRVQQNMNAIEAQAERGLEPGEELIAVIPVRQIRRDVEDSGITVMEAVGAYKNRMPKFEEVEDGSVQVLNKRFAGTRAVVYSRQERERAAKGEAGGGGRGGFG